MSDASTTPGRDSADPQLDPLFVVSHVHWDREWYRGFDGYRGRLVELVDTVCAGLENGTWQSFHLDGQTIVVEDVLAIRPDFEPRIAALVASGRLTLGPWHVLADNQLVSAENLIRNLFRARRWGERIGRLSPIGYSPDAFGHPADLPRILRGFGMDTALVWRGAPPDTARFTWVSPDGSAVFAVNQGYHQTEVLWDEHATSTALHTFVQAEMLRLPDGPHLLLNGGDHLVPKPPAHRIVEAESAGFTLEETTLTSFFDVARAAFMASGVGAQPTVVGELRYPGDRLTFLLPGALSARTYVKLINERAQTLLERFAEPQLARALGRGSTASDASLTKLIDHAWGLVIKNAPHDSICGCSIDEVHRATTVRAESAIESTELVVQRLLLAEGIDTRRHGRPPRERVDIAVTCGHGHAVTGWVTVDVATDPGVGIARVMSHDGNEVAFDVESTRREMLFEADLDLLPDSRDCAIHRVRFWAEDVPAFGWRMFVAHLADVSSGAHDQTGAHNSAALRDSVFDVGPGQTESRPIESGRFSIVVNADASLQITDRDSGIVRDRVGLIVSTGDRGDSYNYDPPRLDRSVTPRMESARVHQTDDQTVIDISATLVLPASLGPDRDSRSDSTVNSPVSISIHHDRGSDQFEWCITIDNAADDHRLRFDVPLVGVPTTWTADQLWSSLTRPISEEVSDLPTEPAHEARYAVAPVHSWASAGTGDDAVALFSRGLHEVQAAVSDGTPTLSVTILRAIGWLSRFDLRTRTTGAGPMLEVPDAQCHGVITVNISVVVGRGGEAGSFELARRAAEHRVPLVAHTVRPESPITRGRSDPASAPNVHAAMVSAWKIAERDDRTTTVLRIWNPIGDEVIARIELPHGVEGVTRARLDETPLDDMPLDRGSTTVPLGPYATATLLLRHRDPESRAR